MLVQWTCGKREGRRNEKMREGNWDGWCGLSANEHGLRDIGHLELDPRVMSNLACMGTNWYGVTGPDRMLSCM